MIYLGPFPDDRFLRDHGWRIKDRPKGSSAVWEHRLLKLELPERDAVANTLRRVRRKHHLKKD